MPAGRIYKSKARGLNTKMVKQVQKIVNKGKVYHEFYQHVSSEANSTGVLLEFTAIAEGNDFNQRESDTILVKHIETKLDYVKADATFNVARVMVVRSMTGPLILTDLPAYNVQADITRYQVLYDKTFATAAVASSTDFNQLVKFKHSFKTPKIPHMTVGYVDAESATAAQKNPIYLYIVGSTASGSTINTLTGSFKINYYDKGQ